MRPLLRATRTIPIVFVNVADPVGAAFINSLSRPGGNATGFIQFEYSLSGKWVELLKQIAPDMTRAAVLRDAAITSGIGQFAVIQAVAPSAGVDVSPINVHDPAEIERAVAAFAQDGGGGLIVTASALSAFHRDRIVAAAARHKLPAIYYSRRHVAAGGLMSYGSDVARAVSPRGGLRRSHPQGRETRRSAGADADEVRARDQSENRECASEFPFPRPCSPAPTR